MKTKQLVYKNRKGIFLNIENNVKEELEEIACDERKSFSLLLHEILTSWLIERKKAKGESNPITNYIQSDIKSFYFEHWPKYENIDIHDLSSIFRNLQPQDMLNVVQCARQFNLTGKDYLTIKNKNIYQSTTLKVKRYG